MADKARDWTDEQLEEMENYLRQIYSEAAKDLKQKYREFTKRLDAKDAVMLKKVESGEITRDEYKEWVRKQMLTSIHWTSLVRYAQDELAKTNQTAIDYMNDKTPAIFAENYNHVSTVIADSPVKGYNFELIDAHTVKNIVKSDGIMLPPPSKQLNIEKDKLWNAKQVNAQLLQGILQGESIRKIADRLENVTDSNRKAAVRNARTMVTAAENSGRQSGMNKAAEDGIEFTKFWINTHDARTRDTHKDAPQGVGGEEQPVNEPFSNGCMFPADWECPDPSEIYNCRCSLGSHITGFNKAKLDRVIEKQREKTKQENEKYERLERTSTDASFNKLLKRLEFNQVEYRRVYDLLEARNDGEIIKSLSGGDLTKGSCASLGLAYIGQRCGWDVVDYRDGASRNTFCKSGVLNLISYMDGIKTLRAEGASDLTVGNRLLKQVEKGKEYYLCVGRHAAIVRRDDDGQLQYLELQSATHSGWTNFDKNARATLSRRFGCSSTSDHRAEVTDFMIDINGSTFGEDFKDLLGFLNTSEDKQKKGRSGYEK